MPHRDYSGLILDVTAQDQLPDQDFLERLGHPVLVCHGPDWGRACPIIKGGCAKVDSAHGVIFRLDLDRPQHRVILERYQEVMPEEVPKIAVVTHDQAKRYASVLTGVSVLTDELSAADLDGFAAQVESADELRTA